MAKIGLRMYYYRLITSDYTEAYRRLMSYLVKHHGPRLAVGGDELGIGRLQFEFLRERDLSGDDTLLDLGCGSLRGGQYFIDYLDAGNYIGMDISEEAIEAGKELIDDGLLAEKRPEFVINGDLRFGEIRREVEYILAQSVFTHLPEPDVSECLSHAHRVLSPGGAFYATFFTDPSQSTIMDFSYSEAEIESLAEETGWGVMVYSKSEFPHPRNQRMVRFTRR